jgi:steroid delta-isomerase-like uncharacterized protein
VSTQPSALEENKALMTEYLERFWNQAEFEASERYVAEDVDLHGLEADLPVPLSPGRAGLLEMRRIFHTAMPDFKMTIDDMIAEDDKLLIRWTGTGTHTGSFMGIPATHRTATWTAMSVARIQDGRMVEGWQCMDNMGMMQQFGVLPGGSPPAPMRWFIAARGRLQARRNRRNKA